MHLENAYPLAPMQHGMLVSSLAAPQSGHYVQQLVCRLQEALDIAVFKEAWQRITARYPVFRTSFNWRDGHSPYQQVHQDPQLQFSEQDWRRVPEPQREELLANFLAADRRRGFELDQAPLSRHALFRFAKAEYCWIWTSHHAVMDGRSRLLVLKELFEIYNDLCAGRTSELSHPPPFHRFIDWLAKQQCPASEQYWSHELAGINAPTPLGVDHAPAVKFTDDLSAHDEQTFRFSKDFTRSLCDVARQHGLTPNTFLQGAWAVLLSRYSGERDIVFGSTRAGRHPDLESPAAMVGLLIHTVPLRMRVYPSQLLLDWLQHLRSQWINLRNYEHTPLVDIQKCSQVPLDQPLFESLLTFENYELNSALQARLRRTVDAEFRLVSQTNYPLAITGELGAELRLTIAYNRRRFEQETISRMLGHLRTLLGSMVANPEQKISELPLLTESERHQLLAQWNDTRRDYPSDKCIHQLFEAQVERTPDAVALVFEDQQLSYRELNSRANQLAHYLKSLGLVPEEIVGICLEGSLEMIVGLLAILKAGGAYLPLDPSYPEERLSFMLQDSGAPVLITQQAFVDAFDYTGKTICLDKDWGMVGQGSANNLVADTSPGSFAYVIYTSGSTGQPKGVAVPHRAVNRLVMNTDYVQVTPAEVMAQGSNVSFDAATFEIWGALLNGAQLVLIAKETLISAKSLSTVIERHGITTLFLTTALFNQMVDQAPTVLGRLRHLLFGGEGVDPQRVHELLQSGGPSRLLHVYGPTETTTFATWHWVKAVAADATTVPIGRPIANTESYILGPDMKPAPIGVRGELYIGGPGVARGYLNRPELTREKFVANPFSSDPTDRLYKTGDLARYLPDGNIEFLGRVDDQVKIRGYRIEPGEIEAVLGQYPAVRESVVLAREDIPGDRRLVAYVVPVPGLAPSASEIRGFLQQKLPEYMVPSAFVFLDSLPLTPNGKVDRKALPAPDQSRPELNETFTPARTPIEEILASIWAEVLKIDKIGFDDNFFHLGGHSLLATQVVSRLTKAFQIELSLRSLFESPTVAGLAERVEHARRQRQGLPPFPMLAVARNKELPTSFAQQRLWFLDQYEPNSAVYNISSGLRLKGSLGVGALEQSLNEIVRRHEALRATFSTHGGESVQLITPILNVSAPILDLRNIPKCERENEAEKLATEQAQEPFDLSQGPLLRVRLICLCEDDHVLLLTMHHIVSDGWSMGIIYRELSLLYPAYTRGTPSPLAELSFQYADFAIWQRQWLQGEVLERQLSYWKKQLDGAPALLNLPSDRPRPSKQTHRGASQSIKLSQQLMEGLRALSARQGVTLFMTLLAAFQTLLHRYTGQKDIVVGSPIANRNNAEIEGLVGFFVNSLALRTDLSGDPTFNELLARVRETTLGAYTHQDLPFEKLVEELRPERSLSHSPLFQVLFNMVEHGDYQFNISGLETAEFPFANLPSKYDLTLYLRSQPDGIQLKLVYNADLFDQPRMACVLQQYRYLLEQIVSAPEQPVRGYSLVTPESRLLLPDPSALLSDSQQELVTSTVLSWANRWPDHSAITQGSRSWTYRELADRAETLALTMVAMGLQQGEVVAIYGDRSFGMIVAMIAALLSGGVLLPIDSSLPDRRKQLMLREAKAKKFLYVGAKQSADTWLAEEFDLAIIKVESQTGCAFDAPTKVNLDSQLLPKLSNDDAAYIFFTSGSAGVPKGVLGSHKGLSHFLHWQRATFGIAPQDRVAQLTNLSFDVVLRDIFLPLTSGATLVLPQDRLEVGSDQTVAWLAQERISILHTVPALAQAWFDSLPQGASLAHMRGIFFAGEPLRAALVKRCREMVPKGCEIINLYGPTETTLAKCFYRVPADTGVGVLPVGQPIANTQALVFADDYRLCGINEAGEIVLRTPFRSLGYINAPQDSRQRFRKNPFRDDNQDLIYFTGDAGRYRPDGTLEILGRLDDQVKIRGVRVEPAEVTAILDRHPLVKSCIVVTGTNEREETCLVAYAVLTAPDNFASKTLRSYLRAHLPAAMVPSSYVFLDKLPLTPNGKVDRRGLPIPQSAEPSEFGEPRTAVEELLAQIWFDVLKLDNGGIHDDFFDLGGHSLLATQLISRIRDTFRVELPLRSLFETPTVAGLAEQMGSARERETRIRALPILPEPIAQEYPLSYSQERFWFLEQLEPNNSAYKIAYGFHLTGPVDIAALEKSLAEIVRRHESLRTTFHDSHNVPVQLVSERWSLRLKVIDGRQERGEDLDTNVHRLFDNEYRQPFDLSTDLLLRAAFIRLGNDENVLFVATHHVAWDHWSMELLFRELSVLYHAFAAGKPSPLSDLPIQYKDYALWQRKIFQSAELENYLVYWKEQLANAPASLNLPTDHPRQPLNHRRGGRQGLVLPKALSRALGDLANRANVTLFMTFLAAFQTLLHRLTGADDIVVGTPLAGRDRSETEGLIGLFLNSLALRTNLSGNPTFVELLAKVREVALGAYDHQELPFEKLVEVLQPERDLTTTPIFQVFINMYNFKEVGLELDGLNVRPLKRLDEPAPQFDLEFYLRERDDGTHLTVVYDSQLFAASTIARMIGHFQTLLEGIVANPEQRIGELPVLTAAEKHQLLVEWNDTQRDYPRDKCIHELFDEQVEKTPDAIAAVFEGRQFSYGELNMRANQLAHYLRKLGVGPEVRVGICVERSLEMVVGLLGILKAGGAYVPLDPSYPQERMGNILADARVAVLLTHQHLFVSLPDHGARIVCLDAIQEELAHETSERLEINAAPENLAYVIYTSGSTGRPKGVAIEHRNTLAFLSWVHSAFTAAELSNVAASTSLCFDLSVFEIFAPLTCGGTIVILENALALAAHPADSKIFLLNTVPSALNELLRLNAIPSSVSVINLAGEPLPTELVRRIREATSVRKVYDLYGPTECTTYSTWALRTSDGPQTIGRPIASTRVYILDVYLNSVPMGVIGEMYIAGDGVARGYLNRPELTAERFICHSFDEEPAQRLYRTGDLARYLPDGNIEFLGRTDDQVKIRGYRIEPGEIEAVLSQYPAVRESVVLAREDIPGDRRLVAYVVPVPGLASAANAIRGFLQQKLPEYMVPSVYVFLDSLPLTANGKLDRKALPAPIPTRPELNETFTPPRTPIEEILASIWRGILKLDKVGINDNFFDLGGHSLLALQLVFKISTVLERDVSVKMLFMHPTITELAGALDDVCKPQEPVQENQLKSVEVAQARKDKAVAQEEVVYVEFERRPLLSLIATGKIAPVDAAALVYLSEETLSRAGLTREAALIDWYDNLPTVDGIYETGLGRVALIMLPRLRSELYNDQDELVSSIVDALEISRQIGARAVSLTGLLPSATDYGQAVATLIAKRSDLPVVTTGHATTVSVVVMTIEKILGDAGRDLAHESVALLGLGSIGYTTLRLMLQSLPHPRKILICDVFSKKTWLDQVCREFVDDLGFKGCVEVAASKHQLPPEVYQTSLIIGATNVADILNISAVKSGTLIVDDSGPHCFATAEAIKRIELEKDILFTEGGVARMPSPWRHVKYLPRRLEQRMQPSFVEAMLTRDPSQIGGCVLSSLLSAGKERLVPTLGLPDDLSCLEHYRGLQRLECSAAKLHCEGYVLPAGLVEEFRRRFGSR